MKLSKSFILSMLGLTALSVYLFITAPVPLAEGSFERHTIPIKVALQILEEENDVARNLYTQAIVGAGKKRKIKFDENWEDEDVIAGPLPAQFMRLTAMSLEQSPMQLGLFLGSDHAINKANKFEGEQLTNFKKVKLTRNPVFFFSPDAERYAYMAPDIASAKPCVTCHNDHEESPKTDWKLHDVMGAATWTYPKGSVGYKEFLDMLQALREAFKFSYEEFLGEMVTMKHPPVIGKNWPKSGRYLPSAEEFMRELTSQSSAISLKTILLTTKVTNTPIKLIEKINKGES